MPDLRGRRPTQPGLQPALPEYGARLGKAVWAVFGPRMSPDFIVERTDQSTLHFSTFLLRDFNEADDMPCGYILARGPADLSLHGSHMYRSAQAHEVVRLLAGGLLQMEQGDLEVTGLTAFRSSRCSTA
jgi:hypothetical protein